MAKVVAKFEKVSYEEFEKTWIEIHPRDNNKVGYIKEIYDSIKLPTRSTKRSSGYDFYNPDTIATNIGKGYSYRIPTGIRCIFFEDGYDLSIYPRSGMGFKYRLHLDNTVGIIDNDYFESDNEGHIIIKISVDPRNDDVITLKPGDKFAQGIFREFFLAEGDDETEKKNRNGGMGSTDEQ